LQSIDSFGSAAGFKSPVADQHINGARPVTQHAQQPPPSSPILSQQTQKQPGSNPVTSMVWNQTLGKTMSLLKKREDEKRDVLVHRSLIQ
jgi:hypothetical protein